MAITLNGTTGITNDGGYTGDGVSFADTTPSNTLVTDTSGNVGIGTSSPTLAKTVISGAYNGYQLALTTASNGTLGALMDSNGAFIGTFSGATTDALRLGTTGSERMRIDSSGNLLVAGTANPNSGKVAVNVANSGRFMSFINNSNSAEIGYIQNNSGTAVIYSTSSDYRLKENIAPMTGALEKVKALKPVTYTWKSTGNEGQGFIAHELQQVCPDAVCGTKDEVDADGNPVYQGIDTSFLVATLTAAIQELKAELDTVKTELATLKGTA